MVTQGEHGTSNPPYDIYNIGNSHPENLMVFVHVLSEELIRAGALPASFNIDEHINLIPMQPGDVALTYADISKIERDYGFSPNTDLRTGLRTFEEWYVTYKGETPR